MVPDAPALIRDDSSASWHNRCAVFDAAPRSVASPMTASVALGVTDPGSSRLVYAMVIGLVLVGVALVVLGIWIIRQTRPDLPVLAPLERMGDRDWKKRDAATQRRMLDELRPDGAEPLSAQAAPPPLDAEFELSGHPVPSLSDLGPGVLAVEDPPAGSGEEGTTTEGADTSESGTADAVADVQVDDRHVDDEGSDDESDVAIGIDDDIDVEGADDPGSGADAVEDAAEPDDQSPDEIAIGEEPLAGDDDERVDDVAADQR